MNLRRWHGWAASPFWTKVARIHPLSLWKRGGADPLSIRWRCPWQKGSARPMAKKKSSRPPHDAAKTALSKPHDAIHRASSEDAFAAARKNMQRRYPSPEIDG